MPLWSGCDQEEKDRAFSDLIRVHERWIEMGARYVTSLDDEFNMVGMPRARQWNFYEVYDIPDPKIVHDMLDLLRYPEPGVVRLDRYFGYEAVIGHPFGSLERRWGRA